MSEVDRDDLLRGVSGWVWSLLSWKNDNKTKHREYNLSKLTSGERPESFERFRYSYGWQSDGI